MKTLEWRDDCLLLIDQTRLPLESEVIVCQTYEEVAQSIEHMQVRGAPAIGLAAAFGVALAARAFAIDEQTFEAKLANAMRRLAATRPTAVNLFWAIDRMVALLASRGGQPPGEVADAILAEARRMLAEDEAANRRMGALGAELIPERANILTHCNAGALATGEFGTALGLIRAAHEQGKEIHVWVDETRPLLQGARLTAWELQQADIPHTLITDNMAGHFMARGAIDLAVVGADRIARNGDTANKIGTYGVAVLARAHGLPFYVVAPTSTVDLAKTSGQDITIEERRPEEVTSLGGRALAPHGTRVANPAFDVTPAKLISAIITEQGIARPPFVRELPRLVKGVGRAAAAPKP
jgi:methylthioribose-1-phosphate isomerase